MSTSTERLKIAAAILSYEARRDSRGRLKVYNLPLGDGGGRYEVGGINERFHPVEAKQMRTLLEEGKFEEAERYALEYIAAYTDVADRWTEHTAVESYLRDCVFNRGSGGAAKIYQMALGVKVDGSVGPITMAEAGEMPPAELLQALRHARERYERDWVGRDSHSKFWKGLVNRWNDALKFAETFLGRGPESVSGEDRPGLPDSRREGEREAVTDETSAARDDGHGSSNPHGKPPIRRFIQSPFNSSRNGSAIKKIVLHCTEASLESVISTFTQNQARQVSVHYVIARDGSIYQMVSDGDRANHAKGANEDSIGIEHIGSDTDSLSEAQTNASAALIRWLLVQYKIPRTEVYGHDFAPGYDRSKGGTSCPDKLFGAAHSQASIQAWVNTHV